jgi:hypothetical protein
MESSPQHRDRPTTTPDAMPTTVIVVGIDGSDSSWDAFWWASGEAHRLHGRVVATFVSPTADANVLVASAALAGTLFDYAAIDKISADRFEHLKHQIEGYGPTTTFPSRVSVLAGTSRPNSCGSPRRITLNLLWSGSRPRCVITSPDRSDVASSANAGHQSLSWSPDWHSQPCPRGLGEMGVCQRDLVRFTDVSRCRGILLGFGACNRRRLQRGRRSAWRV